MWYTMEYYSAIEKNEIMPFAATWMVVENIMLSEVNWIKQISYNIIYMWNLKRKNDTNELIYKTGDRLTYLQNKLMVTKWEKGR